MSSSVLFCSIFYEKDGFYCQPKELPDHEFGGVAVALGQKVSYECSYISGIFVQIIFSLTLKFRFGKPRIGVEYVVFVRMHPLSITVFSV